MATTQMMMNNNKNTINPISIGQKEEKVQERKIWRDIRRKGTGRTRTATTTEWMMGGPMLRTGSNKGGTLLATTILLLASSSLFVFCQAAIADDILRALPATVDPEGQRRFPGAKTAAAAVELRLLADQQGEEAAPPLLMEEDSAKDTKFNFEEQQSIRPEALWWYLLANVNDEAEGRSSLHSKHGSASLKLLKRQRVLNAVVEKSGDDGSSSSEEGRSHQAEDLMELVRAPAKKAPVRRCGTLLIKHIQTVCNGCLRSASDADPIIMSKRGGGGGGHPMLEARNRWKRESGFGKITDICCTQRACDDGELKPFCC